MEKGKPATSIGTGGGGRLPSSQVSVKTSSADLNVSDDFPDSDELAHKYGFDSPQRNEYVTKMVKDANMAEWGDSLLAKLDQKNKEIERLCTLLEAVQATPGIDPNKYSKLMDDSSSGYIDPRDSKIVALAKKCRALTVSLNKERASQEKTSNYVTELEQKCSRLENELKSTPVVSEISAKAVHSSILSGSKDSKEPVDKDKENEKMKKDLISTNKTVEELRRKNDHLNEEIRKLQYALTRELGDGATIDDAVNGNWRGRAQQIIMLKTKVKKLESQLTNNDSTVITTTTNITRRSHDVDSKAEDELADMNSQRRQAVEAITEERFQLIEECKTLEAKNKAQKARITTLEDSTMKQKQQLKVLVDKSDTDDQLIQALSQELQQLRKQISTLSAKNEKQISNQDQKVKMIGTSGSIKTTTTNPDISANKMEIERLQRLCNQQASQLNVQENMIRDLRASLSNHTKNY